MERTISANDMHVIMTQFLNAAEKVHIAMARLDDNHTVQQPLNEAMHAILVGAEQCRQLHSAPKVKLAGGD